METTLTYFEVRCGGCGLCLDILASSAVHLRNQLASLNWHEGISLNNSTRLICAGCANNFKAGVAND